MNSPVCPRCGTPLAPGLTACGRCGLPLGQAAPPAYGAVPPGNAYPPAPPAYGVQPGAPAPGGKPPRRRGLVAAGVIGALLIAAGMAALVFFLTQGDDDKDDVAGDDTSSQSTEDPTDEPTEDPSTESTEDPTDEPTDDPSTESTDDPSTDPSPTGPQTSGTPVVRTPPTGSDEEQIRQLVHDVDTWLQAIFAGDSAQCANMGDYFVDPKAEDIKSCRTSMAQLGSGDNAFTFSPGAITVNGDKGTVMMKTSFTYNGKTENDSEKTDVVKKDGTWYFVED
ncbi:hypothetical protein [Nocardioides sp. Soil796]|uniref:hypothetical protein n=1 Tax=Nocardioides sp. Soil796 TaxID=1736412 RepID=UPI000A6314F6|nr:hypothetical protein [Nocardioides sp. Soil796]